jgi:predicted N-acetyltransferase YhbS
MPITLAPLADADAAAVETLLDAAFGEDRRSRTAYRLREGMAWIADLSLAASDQGRLVGVLQCWPVELRAAYGRIPLVLVGPVAVDPARQREGVGGMMMEAMLARCGGRSPLVLIGDPEYYGRFGFEAGPAGGWNLPGPFERRRLLVRSSDRQLPIDGELGPRLGVVGAEPV